MSRTWRVKLGLNSNSNPVKGGGERGFYDTILMEMALHFAVKEFLGIGTEWFGGRFYISFLLCPK